MKAQTETLSNMQLESRLRGEQSRMSGINASVFDFKSDPQLEDMLKRVISLVRKHFFAVFKFGSPATFFMFRVKDFTCASTADPLPNFRMLIIDKFHQWGVYNFASNKFDYKSPPRMRMKPCLVTLLEGSLAACVQKQDSDDIELVDIEKGCVLETLISAPEIVALDSVNERTIAVAKKRVLSLLISGAVKWSHLK